MLGAWNLIMDSTIIAAVCSHSSPLLIQMPWANYRVRTRIFIHWLMRDTYQMSMNRMWIWHRFWSWDPNYCPGRPPRCPRGSTVGWWKMDDGRLFPALFDYLDQVCTDRVSDIKRSERANIGRFPILYHVGHLSLTGKGALRTSNSLKVLKSGKNSSTSVQKLFVLTCVAIWFVSWWTLNHQIHFSRHQFRSHKYVKKRFWHFDSNSHHARN